MSSFGSFYKQTIKDVPLDGQIVLVRVDYNVPLKPDGKIGDDLRVQASLPTLEYLIRRRCRLVLISHLGRPEGNDAKFSLEPVAAHLATLIKAKVKFCDQTYGDKVKQSVKRLLPGEILVLENLRFHPGEEKNDADFASKIAKSVGARYFVQDGFGASHRAHASTSAITELIPSVAGLLLEKEYLAITENLQNPARPLLAVLGGAKVSDKIGVIERLIKSADQILIGGAMANTFLAYRGFPTGKSKLETDQNDTLERIYKAVNAKVGHDKIDQFLLLPTDVAVASEISPNAKRTVKRREDVSADDIILDIGDGTIERYVNVAKQAKTIFWNGTLGLAEFDQFAHGSARLSLAVAQSKGQTSIVGGGDTTDFVLKWSSGDDSGFSHISTGGGASLELIAGKKLPGIEALLDARSPGRVHLNK